MQASTLLLRQVHPSWVKEDGAVASPAFWPFPKDQNLLSVDDGDRVTPGDSWKRFTSIPTCTSAGVWAVTVSEATERELSVREDPVDGNPFHMVIDFSAHPEKKQKAVAKVLSARASARGCLFEKPVA